MRCRSLLALSIVPFIVTLPVSIWLGKKMALKANSFTDRTVMGVTLFGYSMPHIVSGILFIWIFADIWSIFPASGLETRAFGDIVIHMVLPTIAILIGSFAYLQRYVRANMLEVLSAEYVRTAISKGLDEKTVVNRHVFRNTLIPVSTAIVGYVITGLLAGGGFILENIFSWPGLARLTVAASLSQDIYVVMADLVIYTLLGFVAYIARDVVYAYVDPRVNLR